MVSSRTFHYYISGHAGYDMLLPTESKHLPSHTIGALGLNCSFSTNGSYDATTLRECPVINKPVYTGTFMNTSRNISC